MVKKQKNISVLELSDIIREILNERGMKQIALVKKIHEQNPDSTLVASRLSSFLNKKSDYTLTYNHLIDIANALDLSLIDILSGATGTSVHVNHSRNVQVGNSNKMTIKSNVNAVANGSNSTALAQSEESEQYLGLIAELQNALKEKDLKIYELYEKLVAMGDSENSKK